MHYNLADSQLKISASNGILTVWANNIPDRIEELSLLKLERVYKKWQHLIKEIDSNIAQVLLDDKQKRNEIFSILRQFGFKRYQHFTANQIKALLFYYHKEPSILWQLHSIYPTLNLPENEDEQKIDFSKYIPDLSPFETAQFYLLQNDKLGLIDEMPLSKIMTLFVTRNFINWVSDPDNKAKLAQKEFIEHIEANPLEVSEVMALMGKG
jgi:hypothetical protein